MNKIHDDVLKLWNVIKSQPQISKEQKNHIKALYKGVVRSLRKHPESPRPGAPCACRLSSQFLRPSQIINVAILTADKIPLHLRRKVGATWEYSNNLTGVYLDILHEIATSGTTFLIGVEKASISVEAAKALRSSGPHVVLTTSYYRCAIAGFSNASAANAPLSTLSC